MPTTTLSLKILGKEPRAILSFIEKLKLMFGDYAVTVTSGVRSSNGEHTGKYDFPYFCFLLLTIEAPEVRP